METPDFTTYELPYSDLQIVAAFKRMIDGVQYIPTNSNLFSNQIVTALEKKESGNITTGALARLVVSVRNTGASTNCTIIIYGSPDEAHTTSYILAIFNLKEGSEESPTESGNGINNDWIPTVTWAEIINNDPTNSAIVTATLEMSIATEV